MYHSRIAYSYARRDMNCCIGTSSRGDNTVTKIKFKLVFDIRVAVVSKFVIFKNHVEH